MSVCEVSLGMEQIFAIEDKNGTATAVAVSGMNVAAALRSDTLARDVTYAE